MSTEPKTPTIAGRWQLTMETPAGDKTPILTFIDLGGGRYTGSLEQPGRETGVVSDVRVNGDKLSFKASGRLLVSLSFQFEMTWQADRMAGTVKLGFLPTTAVKGTRIN